MSGMAGLTELMDPGFADQALLKPRVMVAGEFSSGKTRLVNALLGRQVLPSAVVATSLPPIWLTRGRAAPYLVEVSGRTRHFATQDELLAHLARVDVTGVHYAQLFVDSPALEQFDLIDTPGNSDPNIPSICWERMVEHADLLIWCTNAVQAWRQSEKAAWLDLPVEARRNGMLMVTHADHLASAEEQARVRARLEREAGPWFAQMFMGSLQSEADLAPLRRQLDRVVAEIAQELAEDNPELVAAAAAALRPAALPEAAPEVLPEVAPEALPEPLAEPVAEAAPAPEAAPDPAPMPEVSPEPAPVDAGAEVVLPRRVHLEEARRLHVTTRPAAGEAALSVAALLGEAVPEAAAMPGQTPGPEADAASEPVLALAPEARVIPAAASEDPTAALRHALLDAAPEPESEIAWPESAEEAAWPDGDQPDDGQADDDQPEADWPEISIDDLTEAETAEEEVARAAPAIDEALAEDAGPEAPATDASGAPFVETAAEVPVAEASAPAIAPLLEVDSLVDVDDADFESALNRMLNLTPALPEALVVAIPAEPAEGGPATALEEAAETAAEETIEATVDEAGEEAAEDPAEDPLMAALLAGIALPVVAEEPSAPALDSRPAEPVPNDILPVGLAGFGPAALLWSEIRAGLDPQDPAQLLAGIETLVSRLDLALASRLLAAAPPAAAPAKDA